MNGHIWHPVIEVNWLIIGGTVFCRLQLCRSALLVVDCLGNNYLDWSDQQTGASGKMEFEVLPSKPSTSSGGVLASVLAIAHKPSDFF